MRSLSDREKRLVVIWAVAVAAMLVFYFWPANTGGVQVVEAAASIGAAEQRLASVRRLAAMAPQMATHLTDLRTALAKTEESVFQAETAQQAQAEVLQTMRRLAAAQQTPIVFTSVDLGQVRQYGSSDGYGEVAVTVNFRCAVDQLINLLAEITSLPKAIAVEELLITGDNPQTKALTVRLSVTGLVPRTLVPERRGLASF